MATPRYLECNLCGHQQPYEPFAPASCRKCESQWLEAGYDYEAFKREDLGRLPNRPFVTDLTMPGIGGFGLVKELKLDPRTKQIPVIVVSAKDVTPQERERLNGQIEAVYQKGSLQLRNFVDQITQVIQENAENKEYAHE